MECLPRVKYAFLAYGQKNIEKISILCQVDKPDIPINSPGGLKPPAAFLETCRLE